MLNYRIDPAVLAPYVPRGTTLDLWEGEALVSMVGFRFVRTRVLGVQVPLHRNFDEVNLRFYVRAEYDDAVRRGVTFVREIVPRRAIALAARVAYNEPYVALPTRSTAPKGPTDAPGRVDYAWRLGRRWNSLSVRSEGAPAALEPGSEAAFVTEHYWGYTRQRDGGTVEYEVAHPPWRVWAVCGAHLDCDAASLYGREFVDALAAPPRSAFLAEGSPVTVFWPRRLPAVRGAEPDPGS